MNLQCGGIFRHGLQDGAQILEVEHGQPLLVRDAKRDVENAFLRVVEVHDPRQQDRSHLRDRGANRMALLSEDVPEHHGKLVRLIRQPHVACALHERFLGLARGGNSRQVALDVGGENRHAGAGEAFRQNLQRHRLAGAGRAGDQAMAIAELEIEHFILVALADDDRMIRGRRGRGGRSVRGWGRGGLILSLGRSFPSHCCLRIGLCRRVGAIL